MKVKGMTNGNVTIGFSKPEKIVFKVVESMLRVTVGLEGAMY